MTTDRKPRHTADQRNAARTAAPRGVEQRAEYRGQREDRRFAVGTTMSPGVRSATATNSTAITISGQPTVYGVPYSVTDKLGTFTEVVRAGALRAQLANDPDIRFLAEHSGLALARTTSGTLVLTDSPSALNVVATLDPRSTTATDLALAIGRGDVNQMSIGMHVEDDDWDDDFRTRRINRLALSEVSVVSFPASVSTSVAVTSAPETLAAKKKKAVGRPCRNCGGSDRLLSNDPCATCGGSGVDGTQGPDTSPAAAMDGTGTRSDAHWLALQLDLMRIRRPWQERTSKRKK